MNYRYLHNFFLKDLYDLIDSHDVGHFYRQLNYLRDINHFFCHSFELINARNLIGNSDHLLYDCRYFLYVSDNLWHWN